MEKKVTELLTSSLTMIGIFQSTLRVVCGENCVLKNPSIILRIQGVYSTWDKIPLQHILFGEQDSAF